LLKAFQSIHHSRFIARKFELNANYAPKLHQRFAAFDYDRMFIGASVLLNELVERLEKHVPIVGVIHGDPVFSNIFLCKNQLVRFIDMRGKLGGVETIFGDIFYDYAKVYQSLWGYDFIVNDVEINYSYLDNLRGYFEDFFVKKFSLEQLNMLKCVTASLFFSLIPLHSDIEKQKAYFTKARLIIP
jgi:Ser/Thr protein kinase RdoA (MazF antagonist)